MVLGMPKKPAKKKDPIYLSTDCRCGHTYNWHIPGGVCRALRCVCKEFARKPA